MARLNGGNYLLKLKTAYDVNSPELEHPEIIREICETGNVKSVKIQDINGVLLIPTMVVLDHSSFYCEWHQIDIDTDTLSIASYETFSISYAYAFDTLNVQHTYTEA